MKRRFTAIASLVLLLLAGAFALGEAGAAERQVMRFWYSLPAPHARIMDAMVEKYLKETPYRVTLESVNFETPEELCEALLAATAPPHLALIDSAWQKELIENKRLVCAEDMMDKVGSTIKTVYKLNTYPSVWQGNLVDGKAWTVPFHVTTWALLYNKTLFAAHKISAPPATWSETVAVGKKLTKNGMWGFYFPLSGNPRTLSYLFQGFVWQAGGEDLRLESAAALDSPACSEAMRSWVDAVTKHRIAPSVAPRSLGTIAMMAGTAEDYLALEASRMSVGVARLPKHTVEAPVMQILSVAAFAGHEKMLDKVRDFTFFLTKSAQYVFWGLNCPYLPASVQLKGDPVYIPYMREHPGLVFFYDRIIPKARPIPFGYRDGRALDLLGAKIQEALRGESTLQEAVEILKSGNVPTMPVRGKSLPKSEAAPGAKPKSDAAPASPPHTGASSPALPTPVPEQ
jgi:ABC-type glycerol-3-phosphate transport system substrate-binding protein